MSASDMAAEDSGGGVQPAGRPCALVLGGSVLGYSMVQELWENGVREIVLFDAGREFGSYSRHLRQVRRVESSAQCLREALLALRESYDRVVLFPNRDHHLAQLWEIRTDIRDFCYLPFNPDNLLPSLDKITQYDACERLGVPYPHSRAIRSIEAYDALREIRFPVLLKPQQKTSYILRPFELASGADLRAHRARVERYLNAGLHFLASELIPGNGSNIHAYVAFRSADGRTLAEWAGHKLSQHPNEFGVFASATNGSAPAVTEQGRTLVEGMDLQGIVEPEFKYDARDGRYKLTEINLRSMMWSRVGALSGVPIHYVQYLYVRDRATCPPVYAAPPAPDPLRVSHQRDRQPGLPARLLEDLPARDVGWRSAGDRDLGSHGSTPLPGHPLAARLADRHPAAGSLEEGLWAALASLRRETEPPSHPPLR